METAASTVGIGAVIGQSVFAYILLIIVASVVSFVIRGIVISLERLQHATPAAVPAPLQVQVVAAPPPEDETARHVAAIAAAVYAAIGAHRLVYIGEAQTGAAWRTTGRTIHHISHAPKRGAED